jgi:anaerobic ribonucleoside-triphosphate reductase
MIRLHPEQLHGKLRFMDDYIAAANAADGSKMDANANVTHKNIATMENELMKDFLVQVNRAQVSRKISALFGAEWAQEYIRQIEAHEIYVHDETSLKPYCVSVTLYPFLRDGLAKLGGESQAPKHLASFCGSFVNLVFAISAQFAGAVATVEFLTYFDYFARRDYGDDYLSTHAHEVANHLQHVVYSINQPAAARGYQSVFWNISLYDAHYFEAMFGDFVFPDFTKPEWQSVARLQNYFLKWFNQERSKSVLTFPVVTAAMLTDKGECKDKQFADEMAQELAEGNSFFVYLSDNPDSLASCCRLRNQIDDRTFSYTLGAGGVATGSINVITLNMNRLEQDGRDLAEEVGKAPPLSICLPQADGRISGRRHVAGLRCRLYHARQAISHHRHQRHGRSGRSLRHRSGLQPRIHRICARPSENHFRSQQSRLETIRRAFQHRICTGRKPRREKRPMGQSRRL